jgi:hypothetical protein
LDGIGKISADGAKGARIKGVEVHVFDFQTKKEMAKYPFSLGNDNSQ